MNRGATESDARWEQHAFLLTDVEGSTMRWEADRVAMADDLAHHDGLVAFTLASSGGEQVTTLGDGFLYRFAGPTEAVVAAVAVQRALVAPGWPHTPLSVRIGVHVGAAQARGGDFFGPTVGRCARVMAAANGGQILVTREVVEEVGQAAGAVGFHTHGPCRLKDLGEPVELWEVLHEGQSEPSTPRALVDGRHNLPLRMSSFVGREDDIAGLRRLVSDNHLVTLTGSGGVGKTRLALQVAASMADDYPDGTWFVPLDTIVREEHVPDRVLESLGLRPVRGVDALQRLSSAVRGRRMLVVLDCCEHLVNTAAEVVTTLAAEEVTILATSRRPLGVPGEQVWRVRSLRTDGGADRDAAPEALALFLARAAESAPDSDPVPLSQMDAAARVVRLVDGIPLAIELAAARLGALDVAGLERRMAEGIQLSDDSGTRPVRQRTIEATIEWSDRLLSEDAARLLRRLTVFATPPDVAAVEAVCAEGIAEAVVALDELIDASLVHGVEDTGTRRFAMLDAVAGYGDKHWDVLDREEVVARHATWGASIAAAGGPLVHVDGGWLDRLTAASEDLSRGISWMFEHRQEDAVVMATNLAVFWVVTGDASFGRRWLEAALSLSRDWLTSERAKVLEGAGIAAALDADYERSAELLFEAEELFTLLDRHRRAAYPRFWRTRSTVVRGYQGAAHGDELRAAAVELDAVLEVLREHGDALGQVLALPYAGWLRMLLGRPDPEAPLREALALVAAPGLERVAAYATAHLAHIVLVHDGDLERAADLLESAIEELEAAGDRQNILICRLLHAAVDLGRGDDAAARRSVSRAAALAARGGSREWEPAVLAMGWATTAESEPFLAWSMAGRLDDCLPTWRDLLRNTGVDLGEVGPADEAAVAVVRRTAEVSGRRQSTDDLIDELARVER